MAFDVYGNVSESLEQGGSPQDVLKNFLSKFKGRQKSFRHYQKEIGPFVATGLYNLPAYDYLQDFRSRPEETQKYGRIAGSIGRQGREFQESRQGQLGLQGLGRSSAQAAVAQQATSGSTQAQAGAFADLQARQREMEVAFAQQAFDVDRAIAQMVLSAIPGYQPRQSSGGGLGGALGGALGMGLGALLGGPAGAMAGGGAGSKLGELFD